MTIADVRLTASKMLDGMKFNKEKLAKDCLEVCDLADRLDAALNSERKKNAALIRELAGVTASRSSENGLPKEFGDIFGDIFGSGGKQPQGH